MATLELVRRPDRQRYELIRAGVHLGHVTYVMRGGVLILEHTTILPEFSGQGLGSVLARAILDEMGARGRPYRVECEFLRGWIAKHPDYRPRTRASVVQAHPADPAPPPS